MDPLVQKPPPDDLAHAYQLQHNLPEQVVEVGRIRPDREQETVVIQDHPLEEK